jgi:hypothetical protein
VSEPVRRSFSEGGCLRGRETVQKNIKKVLKTDLFLLKSGAFLLRNGAFLLKNTKKYAFFPYPSCLIVATQPPDPHFQPKIKHQSQKITQNLPKFPIF